MDNQKPSMKEEQTMQWPNEKGQNDKQRSTNIDKQNITFIFTNST
jgi:hypothetical protein